MLYKYRPINLNTIKTLLHNSLYCSDPVSFNDPFDANFTIDFTDLFYKNPLDFCNKLILNYIELKDFKMANDSRDFIKDLIDKNAIEDIKRYILDQFNKMFEIEGVEEDVGVLCFSKKCDNILMWSHYADKHKGIVLGFDTSKEPLIHARAVEYPVDNELYKFSIENPFDKSLVESLFRKAKDWEYEAEVRYVNPNGPGLVEYSYDALKIVCFGCRTSDEDIKTIMKILKNKKQEVEYFRARKDDDFYRLQLIPLNKIFDLDLTIKN